MDTSFWATAGLLLVGAITPGPNNFMVLREATRRGWRGALPAIAGVLAGTLFLLLLTAVGLGAALAAEPRLARAVAVAGCAYLAYLGLRLAARRASPDDTEGDPEGPSAAPRWATGAWGLALFQLLNPKAWLLTLTVTASAQARLGPVAALPTLAVLFVVVLAPCLALWSWAGVALRGRLAAPRSRAWLDRAMGLLLVACAIALLIETWSQS